MAASGRPGDWRLKAKERGTAPAGKVWMPWKTPTSVPTHTLSALAGSTSIAWAGDPAAQLGSYGGKVRAYNGANGTTKRWVATAMPGYDDTHIPGRGKTFAVDRAGGAYYQQTFKGAIASSPDWVMVTSFNEWLEGHQIEPSVSYGTLFLDLTRTLGDAFRKMAVGLATDS